MKHFLPSNKDVKKTVVTALLCAVLAFVCGFSAYAYFTTRAVVYTGDGSIEHAQLGMSLDLLFDQLNSDSSLTQLTAGQDIGTGTVFDPDAKWGSAANPYIISNIRHLQNLSTLQEIGYFDDLYIQDNYTGDTYNGGKSIPYFLVCDPDGTPTTIDGTGMTFSPIGTDEYPFYGFVGGAFIDGTTTLDGKSSDTSAIYNLTVQTDTDVIDVGLFGTIGYLGDDSSVDASGNFTGQVSTVENLLLYDVKIKVNQPSLADQIEHLFMYNFLPDADKDKIAHENHHVGILAGHVEYANVNYISVYYSDESITAIDISHCEEANFLSNTGIIGFIYNMNPSISENGIGAGSGDSSDTISVNASIGSGGGSLSGTGRGYVSAKNIYDKCSGSGTLKLTEASIGSDPLCDQYYRKRAWPASIWQGPEATDCYYFYDTVFTFALSKKAPCNDRIEPTWVDEYGNEKSVSDTFTVSTNKDASWKKNTSQGNNMVLAYVKELTSMEDLNKAVFEDHKQIYIGYDGGATVSLMSLTKGANAASGFFSDFGDDKYTAVSLRNPWIIDDSSIESVCETLQYAIDHGEQMQGMLPYGPDNDEKNQYLINNINEYKLINLGSGDDLDEIRDYYPVNVSRGVKDTGKYIFENKGNILSIVVGRPLFRNYYSIYAGPNPPSTRYVQDKEATVTYEDGSFYLNYSVSNSYGGNSRYVQYNVSQDRFEGNLRKNAGTNLKLYTVEGTSNLNFGRVTYDPTTAAAVFDYSSSNTGNYTFDAGKSVLWPEGGNTFSIKHLEGEVPETSDENLKKNILLSENGWKRIVDSGSGATDLKLTSADMTKKFVMEEEATNCTVVTLLGGNIDVGQLIGNDESSKRTIVAPVGSNGYEANIPQGTLAFRVNKAGPEIKLRVIVAVPQCDYYSGENNDVHRTEIGNFYSGNPRFGLWYVPANGENAVNTFDTESPTQSFNLPRSNPYDPSSTAGSSNYILIKNSDGSISRCYLNGNRVLVAYEFTVQQEGIYLLTSIDTPMEIVYFAADNTASAGRDGSSGSKLGTIDFVYDHSGKVVTVKESTPDTVEHPNANGEDYDYYYASQCLLYTDNNSTGFPNINNAQIKVKRYVTGTIPEQTSHMTMTVSGEDADLVILAPYAPSADIVD